MSRSDKRGATLPKVATVVLLLRNDVFFLPSLAGKVATSVAKLSDEFPEGWFSAERILRIIKRAWRYLKK